MNTLQQQKQEIVASASSQQRLAADPKVSVWVEASAGTGKTKVLSDRVLRLLLNGVNPSRILCLTYTKAAAVEMSNRIAERLSKWAVASDEKLEQELEKLLGMPLRNYARAEKLMAQARRLFAILLDTPGGVKIQTIHSFCQEILKRFPLEAKVSPYFEIMDDRSANEALENIKRDILQGNVSGEVAEALGFLTSSTTEFTFPKIMASITEERNHLETYWQRYKTVSSLIQAAADVLKIEPNETETNIEECFWHDFPATEFKTILTALGVGSDTSRRKAFEMAEAFEKKDFAAYGRVFVTDDRLNGKVLSVASKKQYPEVEKLILREVERFVEAKNKICKLKLFQSTKAVLLLADELLGRYQRYKKQRAKMDYNDLILLTKRLLETPKVAEWILFKLDGGIDNVLIDEAQDTSPEQWAIIKALTAEFFSGLGAGDTQPTVFVVGDRKQSIYSFQGADPAAFEKMHSYFATQTTGFRDVNMEVSFRSTAAVLDVVNAVFASEKARSGVARGEQNIEHKPSRIGDGGVVEFWPLVVSDDNEKSNKVWLPPVERMTEMSSSAKLAQQIAETIKAKVANGEMLKSEGRPLKYRDFLILVQRRNAFVDEIVRACKNVGVAITGVDKIKLLEQIAVQDLIALAKFVLLPEDDLNLACVLKSPLLGFDDDDLLNLCYGRNDKSLWQCLQNNNQYVSAADDLRALLQLSEKVRPFEFFSYALNEKKGRQKLVARLGYECEDALDEFVNLSLNFEREHIPSMQLFIEWVLKDDVVIKRELEQNDIDAVRLMTVHGSKGLQAPVVVLPDTVRVKAVNEDAGWLKDEDALFYPLGKAYYETNCRRLKQRERALELEEYHRLLYVALTRAGERLCICGYAGKKKPNEESWYEICKNALNGIVQVKEDGKAVYEVEQLLKTEAVLSDVVEKVPTELPCWLGCNPKDEGLLARPLTPSHQDETSVSALSPLAQSNDAKLYSRGRLIHKLLQFLPEADEKQRLAMAEEFLCRQENNIAESEQRKIVNEVLSLLNNPEFAPLFGKNSLAEAALMGLVGDRIVSGQIDRLAVTKDKVMIVDYKTNRPAAEKTEDIPMAYVKQMRSYKQLVEKIYPGRQVHTYILWTNTARMMEIK